MDESYNRIMDDDQEPIKKPKRTPVPLFPIEPEESVRRREEEIRAAQEAFDKQRKATERRNKYGLLFGLGAFVLGLIFWKYGFKLFSGNPSLISNLPVP